MPGRLNTKTERARSVERRLYACHRPPSRAEDKNHRADQRPGPPEGGRTREAARDNTGESDQAAGDAAEAGAARRADRLEATRQVLLLR